MRRKVDMLNRRVVIRQRTRTIALAKVLHRDSELTVNQLLTALLQATLLVTGLCAVVVVAYIVKSALGIDLLPGPSPLHDLLYPLLRR